MTTESNESALCEISDAETLPLSEKTFVLVKFTLNNLKLVPSDIRQIERLPDNKVDMAHRLDALRLKLGREVMQAGRFREGRVDTGIPMIQNQGLSHAALLRRGLANNGFLLVDMHYFVKPAGPNPWDKQKFVVVTSYSPFEHDKPLELSDQVMTALRALSAITFRDCVVWDNPNGSLTVNLGGRAPDQKPKRAIRVQNGKIVSAPVQDFLGEEEE